jgi:hypothetical protein
MLLFFDFWLKTIDDLRPELFFVLRLLFLLSTSLLSLSFSLSSSWQVVKISGIGASPRSLNWTS